MAISEQEKQEIIDAVLAAIRLTEAETKPVRIRLLTYGSSLMTQHQNDVIESGRPVFAIDDNLFYMGDGVTALKDLVAIGGGADLLAHIENVSNPHSVTKTQVGLGNVLNVEQEPAITAGTTAQYWRGDKSWQDFKTAVLSSVLTGFSAGAGVVAATDTILQAFNKIVGNALNYALLNANNAWTAAQRNTPVTLTSVSNSIAINLNQSNNYNHVLTENTTLANPTNAVEGQAGNVFITQDSDTAKTLAFDTNWKKAKGSATAVPTTLDAKCSIEYRVLAADYVLYSIVVEDGVV